MFYSITGFYALVTAMWNDFSGMSNRKKVVKAIKDFMEILSILSKLW